MIVNCGQCGGAVTVPESGRRVGFCVCGCTVAPEGTPISEVRAALADRGLSPLPASVDDQMAEWAARHGVTPLARVQEDARAAFAAGAVERAEFYASWSAYDAALVMMPAAQQALQAKAEVYELTRMAGL